MPKLGEKIKYLQFCISEGSADPNGLKGSADPDDPNDPKGSADPDDPNAAGAECGALGHFSS